MEREVILNRLGGWMVCAFTLFFALRWDNSQLQSPPSFQFQSGDWLVRVKLNDRQLCCAYNHPAVDSCSRFGAYTNKNLQATSA